MSAIFKPLRSTHGFESPGFSVDNVGNIVVSGTLQLNSAITLSDDIYVEQLFVNNIPLTENSGSGLGVGVVTSHLTSLGILTGLNVKGNVSILDSVNNQNLSINNGGITIRSTSVGSVDNVNIGINSPGYANFKDVSIGQTGTDAILTVNGTMSVSNSANIPTITNVTLGSTTGNITTVNSTTGNITTVNSTTGNITTINADNVETDEIRINNTPTQPYHSTRKDYVDSRITAFSIGFGA